MSCLLLVTEKGVFTVGALDNLDHNPSSITSLSSLQGTAISLFQLPTKSDTGESRSPIVIPPTSNANHYRPDSYASFPANALKTSAVEVPECDVHAVKADEYSWVEHALRFLEKEKLTSVDIIAWDASMHSLAVEPPSQCVLLPLFYEKSATPVMIWHGMNVQRQAFELLTPGLIPVTTFDQPLPLAKSVGLQ